jgi:hypothetical protein
MPTSLQQLTLVSHGCTLDLATVAMSSACPINRYWFISARRVQIRLNLYPAPCEATQAQSMLRAGSPEKPI